VKGETVVIARPSLLLGPWRRYRAIEADRVAASLLASVRDGFPGALVLESDALQAHIVE